MSKKRFLVEIISPAYNQNMDDIVMHLPINCTHLEHTINAQIAQRMWKEYLTHFMRLLVYFMTVPNVTRVS